MDFLNLIENRYSCRNFLKKEIEKEKINKILDCGRIAPTACNMQPQRILVLNKKDSLEKLSSAANIYNTPLALVICGDKNNVWICFFDPKQVKNVLNIPDELEVISILALGYSNEKAPSSDRYSQERLPLSKTTFLD